MKGSCACFTARGPREKSWWQAPVQLAAQTQLEWLDKQLNRHEFITGPRYRIAGITTQPGVGFWYAGGGTRAGPELDPALANVFAMAQLKCRAALARRSLLQEGLDFRASLGFDFGY